jgi:DNA ligase-1
VELRAGGVHLPQLGLWLDPQDPQTGPEHVFVSHAHSDHIAPHREVILSAPTAQLMRARIPDPRKEVTLQFGETRRFESGSEVFDLTLLPAGHIFGSAMALVEAEGQKLLYTGDFKLRRGLSAEPCEPRPADILIMETTFGRPQYLFPPTEEVLRGVVRFCREALDNDETPVLLGYSLGKSQELLCGLGDAALPIMLHGSVWKLTRIYEQFGQCFPPYEAYQAGTAQGKVLLCPPYVANSAMLRNLGRRRAAILTGWAVDPDCRYRYQCDAAFPLSDHADFSELIAFVRQVQPKQVFTLHGFAADFAQTLRDLGFNAQALSQNEQFGLPFAMESPKSKVQSPKPADVAIVSVTEHGTRNTDPSPPTEGSDLPAPDAFARFALTCSRIAADARKLEKVRVLAEYLSALKEESIPLATTWFTGKPFPANQNKVLQLGWAVMRDALCAVGGINEAALHQVYLKHSDIGETAAEVLSAHPAAATLSLGDVNRLFGQLQVARGPLAKTPLLKGALERCAPSEAKYLVKIITGDLRIGLKEGLVEEAVAAAFAEPAEKVRQVNLLLGDIGATATLSSEHRLASASLTPFRPAKFMLASPEPTAADVWERMGKTTEISASSSDVDKQSSSTVWLEDKYDGVRCQLHKVGGRVALYSRDLKDVTSTFFEIVDAAKSLAQDVVLDGEIVAMRGQDVLPFAELQKRLGRRQGDLFMREEVPIKFVVFDLLWSEGQSLLNRPLHERRQTLEGFEPLPHNLVLAHITQAKSAEEIDAAFDAARGRGNEGLMIKDPESPYTPGRRGLTWLKLKKAFATLDCVVVGAEYGHGKRNKVLSDYTFAVRDERSGELKVIGKAYTGLTDAEIAGLTTHFLKTAIRQHGRYFEVPPDTVLEIAFDKIQLSERHNSGLAMRFPRIVRIRTDKSPAEIDTLANARKLIS